MSMMSGMLAGVAGVCGAEGEASDAYPPPPGTGSRALARGSLMPPMPLILLP